MSALSFYPDGDENGVAQVVANPIFVILQDGETLTFEVLAVDASTLQTLIKKQELYVYEGKLLWGELISLDACESTVNALLFLRDKPAMRGVIKAHATLTENLRGDDIQ